MKYLMVLSVLALAGCGSDGDDGDNGAGGAGGGGPAPATNCVARCETKLTDCGQGQSAEALCADTCGGSITNEQLTCAENAECSALLNGTDNCGIGDDGGGECPQITCNCPPEATGVYTVNGRCLRTCEEVCEVLAGI